ncbi:hypothetical protein KP509_14G024500 [Ceratopteris richardii]|nr:hypothetical protein KP509_14G024500 [Ceratopteris richardii]
MEQTTWKDNKVREAIKDQYLTLRVDHRSVHAAHFFAIYPYYVVPNVSIISSSGRLLKQLGGYISPDELLGMLDQCKAMQAAATLVAALASTGMGSSVLSAQDQVRDLASASASTSTFVRQPQTNSNPNVMKLQVSTYEQGHQASAEADDRVTEAECRGSNLDLCKQTTSVAGSETSEVDAQGLLSVCRSSLDGSTSLSGSQTDEKVEGNIKEQIDLPFVGANVLGAVSECQEEALQKKKVPIVESDTAEDLTEYKSSYDTGRENAASSSNLDRGKNKRSANMDASKPVQEQSSSYQKEERPNFKQQSKDLVIQIRLPNGKSIHNNFRPSDALSVVREFVQNNRDDGGSACSLAVLYPRKVFCQEDMEKSLLELNLEDRATLVLVPNSSSEPKFKSRESSTTQSVSQPEVSATYGGIWKLLSYLNPFSYFSGSSNAPEKAEAGTSSWQYEPNLHLQNALRYNREKGSQGVDNSTVSDTKKSQGKSWGSNIRTLDHSNNDDAFKRGNAFWNGNSTQYGGDDSQK